MGVWRREVFMCEDSDRTDEQDYLDAAEVLERVRKGEEKTYTSAEVRKELGLDDEEAIDA